MIIFNDVQKTVTHLIERLGRVTVTEDIGDEGELEIRFVVDGRFIACAITTDWPVFGASVTSKKGFRLWWTKDHPGGRWHPPEDEDVTIIETLSLDDAIAAAFAYIAREHLSMARGSEQT